MTDDLHIQISIEYSPQRRVRYRSLTEPHKGQHDHIVAQLPDPPLTLHLYWCPRLPNEDTQEILLPGLEQFVRHTLTAQVQQPDKIPARYPHYQAIYNTLTRQTYVYNDGEWQPEVRRTERRLLSLSNNRW